MMKQIKIWLALMSVVTFNALAVQIDKTVTENKLEAVIHLPGGIEADITLTFENSVGLTADSVGLSAELVNITDTALLNRLPGLNTSIPAAFPMMITIEPLADKGLSFAGVASLEIHTHNLEYTANTPLRFFKASLGKPFRDITVTTGAGSYRARGIMGDFSQFLVVTDLRTKTQVAQVKAQRLSMLVNDFQNDMSADAAQTTLSLASLIESAVANANYAQALVYVKQFEDYVEQHRGDSIGDIWRSSRDINNVAGELLAQSGTLAYSLRLSL